MESLLLLADLLAIAALVFTSLRNDRLGPGDAQVGPFRFNREKSTREAKSRPGRDPRTGRRLPTAAPGDASRRGTKP